MNKRLPVFFRILSALIVLAMILSPAFEVRAAGEKIGLVVNEGGIADLSFNYMANQGLLQAETDLGIDGTLYEPATSGDYETALQQCVTDGNILCIAVGFDMATAASNAATANPGTKFAILDYSYETPPTNLRGILFNEKEVGYLAGVLAAEMTDSDVVGVVGGMQIPPVIRFVEGYQNGAQCSNKNLEVLVNYTGTFGDPGLGATVAAIMMANSADIIFGAAGPTGNGAILYSAQNGGWSIGVDTDQYLSVFGNGTVAGSDRIYTSAMKRLDNAVYMTIQDVLAGTFTSDTVTYDLSNDGVGLAPFHETDAVIPNSVNAHLNATKNGIIGGSINVDYPCRGPVLVEPLDGVNAHTRRPFFDWEEVSGALSYTLEVSTAHDFATKKINVTLAATSYIHRADLAASTLYYWRVRVNPVAGASLYSDIYSFTTGNPPSTPSLGTPRRNALVTNLRPTFDWRDVRFPSGTTFNYYQIQVATDPAFDLPTILIDDFTTPLDVTDSDYTPSFDLSAATTYYWRVRSLNTADDFSAWSLVRTFRTAYNPPTLIGPDGGSISLRPTFTWNAVIGATSYKIQVSTVNTFKSKVVNVTVYTNSYTMTKDLLPATTYYWHVQALGPYGPSLWSAFLTFFTP